MKYEWMKDDHVLTIGLQYSLPTVHSAQSGIRTHKHLGLSRAALPLRIRARVVLDGLEPPIVTL